MVKLGLINPDCINDVKSNHDISSSVFAVITQRGWIYSVLLSYALNFVCDFLLCLKGALHGKPDILI